MWNRGTEASCLDVFEEAEATTGLAKLQFGAGEQEIEQLISPAGSKPTHMWDWCQGEAGGIGVGRVYIKTRVYELREHTHAVSYVTFKTGLAGGVL